MGIYALDYDRTARPNGTAGYDISEACTRANVHSFARHRLDRRNLMGGIHALFYFHLRLWQFL